MPNRFGPGCQCCGCIKTTDDFETGLIDTAKWTEVQGTWAVSCPTTCHLASSAAHSIIKTVATVDGYHAVVADVDAADQTRLIIHLEDDENYIAAEFDSSFGGTITIFTRSGGVDTQRATKGAPVTTSQAWTFCSNSTCYSLYSADGSYNISWDHSGSVPTGALSAGVASKPGTSVATVNDFLFYEPDTGDECDECSCGCTGCFKHGADPAPTMTADITAAWDSAGCPNLTVDASYGLTKTDDCEWQYSVAAADNIVHEITIDASVSPPTIRIDYTHDAVADFALMQLNSSTFTDCSEGNVSGTFGAITGVCFDGLNSVTVTG